nr:hypothetical protein [Tanacetum cinerariifolium]
LNGSEERSDWDDDERSGGKNLVIQEKLTQNQQDFLDEYLPQWDDYCLQELKLNRPVPLFPEARRTRI